MTISYDNDQLEEIRTRLHSSVYSMTWLTSTLELVINHGRNANDEIERLIEENRELQGRLQDAKQDLCYWSNR